jgi:hypothetical protein
LTVNTSYSKWTKWLKIFLFKEGDVLEEAEVEKVREVSNADEDILIHVHLRLLT